MVSIRVVSIRKSRIDIRMGFWQIDIIMGFWQVSKAFRMDEKGNVSRKIMSDESRHSVSDVCCFLVALLKVSQGMEIVFVGGIFV